MRYFADLDVATAHVAKTRWPDGPVCPACGLVDPKHYFLKTRRMWKCRSCKKQFSVKVGTIFEDSPIGLDKWLPAMWMVGNCKNGISSYEVARDLGVTQKTAWFMMHRIRLAMRQGSIEKLSGEVEVDETYIGGKARNMHKSKRAEKITGRGMSGKVAVMGLLERHGKVKTQVVPDTSSRTLQVEVRENVEPGSEVHTDALRSYRGLDAEYIHNVVDHAERYVNGNVPHERVGELLEPLEAGHQGNLRQRRALPPFPLPGRAGFQVQRAGRRGRGAVPKNARGRGGATAYL